MGSRLQVLLIGRDPAWCRFFCGLLDSRVWAVATAADGVEALAAAGAQRPAIVLADGGAPGGLDCVRALHAADGGAPYLLVSIARSAQESLAAYLEAGIDDFIALPLNGELVLARLELARQMLALRSENRHYLMRLRDYSDELASLHFRVRELAASDALTGLPNRQRALACLDDAWSAAHRGDSPLACVVVLLAGLRQINHRHGYERGDVVLKTVAAFLKTEVRSEDVLCRIDGNEFLVICPGTGVEAARVFASRLLARLGETFGRHAGGTPLDLHIGIAERGADVTGAQVLVNLASFSAHRARRLGGGEPYAVQVGAARPASRGRRPAGRVAAMAPGLALS